MIVMGPGRNHKCGKKRHVREGAVTLAGREVGRHDVRGGQSAVMLAGSRGGSCDAGRGAGSTGRLDVRGGAGAVILPGRGWKGRE